VNAYWTLDESAATLFAQKMVQNNACLALAFHAAGVWASPLYVAAARRTSVCFSIVHDAMMQRSSQAWRWERRKARVRWVLCAV
jgi:hypothetical protein